jgi:putative phosphoesterase
MRRIGLISDTHGLLRPEAVSFLRGCNHIIHAGDVGSAHVLEELAALAPLTAVRGNNDAGAWAEALHEFETLRIGGVAIDVIHDVGELRRRDSRTGARVVVSGHSHKPRVEQRGEILFVNPGSAGPRRFKLPVSVAELVVDHDASVAARIHELVLMPGVRTGKR